MSLVGPGSEPCALCDEPMIVTGRNVRLGGVEVGTTWACKNRKCEGYNPNAKEAR